MRYEIDESTYAISMFESDNEIPFLFQPFWPDQTPWASKKEAEDWAKAKIEELSNPNSEYWAGVTPSEPLMPRPIDYRQSALEKLIALGLSEEEAKAVIGF